MVTNCMHFFGIKKSIQQLCLLCSELTCVGFLPGAQVRRDTHEEIKIYNKQNSSNNENSVIKNVENIQVAKSSNCSNTFQFLTYFSICFNGSEDLFRSGSSHPIPRLPTASSFQWSTGFGGPQLPCGKTIRISQHVWWHDILQTVGIHTYIRILSTLVKCFILILPILQIWKQKFSSNNLWWSFISPNNDPPVYACVSNTGKPWRALVSDRLIDSNLKHDGAWWAHVGNLLKMPKQSSARAGRSSTA